MNEENRVFVIGLDGATFDLILPWVEKGYLPCFKNLLKGSAWGELESTSPPLTAPAWSSFMTGKLPGNHGVFDFFAREEESYEQRLNSIQDLKEDIFWEIIGDTGKKVGIINVPFTYPPRKLNGFMITGLLTPRNSEIYSFPVTLQEELEKELGNYLIHHNEKYNGKNMEEFLEEQYAILDNRTQAGIYLAREKEWQFFMIHYYGTDRVQHEFWHLHDVTHPQHRPAVKEKYGNVILNYFKKLDSHLDELIKELDENSILMVLSDHGFGKIEKFFNVNTWLMKEGFLVLKKSLLTRFRYFLFKLGMNYTYLAKLILALGLGKRAVMAGRGKRQKFQEKLFLSLRDVDWSKSRAYSLGNFGQIYINLKGREPAGIVSPHPEYDKVVNSLIERLSVLRDPESGEEVVEKTSKKEELFKGKYSQHAPDLFFLTKDMKYKAFGLADFSSNKILEPAFGSSGHHKMNGIFVIKRKGVVKENHSIQSARIFDLAPTILYLLGIPVPSDMEGRVLTEIFQEDYLKRNKIKYKKVERKIDPKDRKAVYTKKEEEEVKKQLRDLGYI